MITTQLREELLAADSAKQAIELILENCWFDWQQDEAFEFVEENTTLFDQ
jgi:hypothetical protein